jgi:hypothetical protein
VRRLSTGLLAAGGTAACAASGHAHGHVLILWGGAGAIATGLVAAYAFPPPRGGQFSIDWLRRKCRQIFNHGAQHARPVEALSEPCPTPVRGASSLQEALEAISQTTIASALDAVGRTDLGEALTSSSNQIALQEAVGYEIKQVAPGRNGRSGPAEN